MFRKAMLRQGVSIMLAMTGLAAARAFAQTPIPISGPRDPAQSPAGTPKRTDT